MSGLTDVDLEIAEHLVKGLTYRKIKDLLRVGSSRISKVKKLLEEGLIRLDEAGRAYAADSLALDLKALHEKVMGVVTKKATEEAIVAAEEDYMIGRELRQYWSLKAKEAGMTLREYVKVALIFYDDYKDEIEKLEELREIARMCIEVLQKESVKKERMRLYYKFIGFCLTLKAQGYTVPQQVINDFVADLNLLSEGRKVGFPFMSED